MSIEQELNFIKDQMKKDNDFAWSWHCNIAMPIYDSTNLSKRKCNQIAVNLMRHLFDVDTSENKHYEYKLN